MRLQKPTQQKEHSTTRIVHHTDASASTDLKVTVAVRKTQEMSRWEGNSQEFQGFNSPPGRF